MRWLAAAAVGLLLGCGGGGDRVVVGSKNFTEQRILGELLAQTADSVGLKVQRRLDLGGTFVCDAAIRAGQIDMYVEYTGTALTAILKEQPGAFGTASEIVRAPASPRTTSANVLSKPSGAVHARSAGA